MLEFEVFTLIFNCTFFQKLFFAVSYSYLFTVQLSTLMQFWLHTLQTSKSKKSSKNQINVWWSVQNVTIYTHKCFFWFQRPPSSSLSYGGPVNDDVRSPGTPGPLSQPPASQQSLDASDPGESTFLCTTSSGKNILMVDCNFV